MKKTYENIKKLISYSKEGIISKVLLKTGKVNITLFCMAKDTDMGEHTSTKEGIVYVIEGNGIFNLEGNEIKMVPGTMIFMKKNAAHSLAAEENTSFILYLYD